MPLFMFYPRRPDGSSTTFEMLEQADADAALNRARQVLREHDSAVEVVVWRGNRRVGAVARISDPA